MRLIIFILILVITNNVFGQNKLVTKFKRTDSTILLRWAISDYDTFKECIVNGYRIKKIEISSNDNFSNLDWSKSEEINIYPYTEKDSFWINYQNVDERVLLIQNLLFSQEKIEKIVQQNILNLSLVTCDQNLELAKAAGLFFEDKDVSKGKNYAYQIQAKGKSQLTYEIYVNNENLIYPEIQKFELSKKSKSVEIVWKHSELMNHFSSFQIYRSLDSIYFIPLLKQRYVPMSSQFEKEKEFSFWSDSSIKYNQKYFYKVVAYDYFGEDVKETEVKSIHLYPPLQTQIIIDTIFELEPNRVTVSWSSIQDSNIFEYHIYHSNNFNGEYQFIERTNQQKVSVPIRSYSNYFKVVAISKYGDSISSWPELFIFPDKNAPEAVQNLNGSIDSLGNVTVTWNSKDESDLKGYRVFRSNSKNEEFIEVSRYFIQENIFHDSIYLDNLTEEILYYVKAVDNNYNHSFAQDTLVLKKPDFIPPVAAQFKSIQSDKKGILIEWVNSSSVDVANTQLLFSLDNINFQTRVEWNNSNSNAYYLDTLIENGIGIYYQLKVMDDDGNYSNSKSIYIESQKNKDGKKYQVEAKVDRVEKWIELSWESTNEKVYSYTIYKAKQGEPLRSYVTLDDTQYNYRDRNLYISNNYTYTIKATLESGNEVMLVENLVVEY